MAHAYIHAGCVVQQIEDGLRLQKVQAIIEAAKQQCDAKDLSACLSTIENGLRIDAGACVCSMLARASGVCPNVCSLLWLSDRPLHAPTEQATRR